jgi:pre-mRNA-processing factor 40
MMFVIVFHYLPDSFLPICKISIQLAREQAHKTVSQGTVSETSDTSNAAASSAAASTPPNAASSNTLTSNGFASSPSSITPIVATDQQRLVSGLSGTSVSHSVVTSSTTGVEPSTVVTVSTAPTTVAGSSGVAASSLDSKIPSMYEIMFCKFFFFL